MRPINARGYSLVELLLATAIMAGLVGMVTGVRAFMAKQTVRTTEKAYAGQKAVQMFEELRSLVGGVESDITLLDDYSDGSSFNPVLTTDKSVDIKLGDPGYPGDPGNPLSDNRSFNGRWKYLRQVQVKKIANDAYVRQVTVKVFRSSQEAPDQPDELLATVGGMMRTIATVKPPTQVLDVYVLAVNNISAWWAVLPRLSSTMKSVIQDIQDRNPGLELRTHIINRGAFGRDAQYIPYINWGSASHLVGFPWVYLYTGLVQEENSPNGSGTGTAFYDAGPEGVLRTGNFNVDGNVLSPTLFSGCPSFPVADQFNHGVRYPDELAAYEAVSQLAVASGNPAPEISLRMLMEGMLSSPASFTNSILINLHGELIPLPPMRNYSDPAKDPAAQPNVRVVTHPERIYSPGSGSVTVDLRVYAYYDGLDRPTTTELNSRYPEGASAAVKRKVDAISVLMRGVSVAAADLAVTAIVAQFNGGAVTNYTANLVAAGGSAAADASVSWVLSHPTGGGVTHTLLTFHNTGLRCQQASNGTGLPVTSRLYGLEYVPCPVTTTANFDPNLTNTQNRPKNTARWTVQVRNVPTGSAPLTIETRLGDGVTASSFPNLSRTYAWIGNSNPPPVTEQFQFIGDPRHCPYLDVKSGGLAVAGAGATIESNGYNWFFKNLDGTVDGYSGFSGAGNVTGWGGDQSNVDIPRYYAMIRHGLLSTTSIWATTNGYSFYYWGIGGEFGFDHPPYSGSITVQQGAWTDTGTVTTTTRVDEIIDSAGGGQNTARVIGGTAFPGAVSQWYSKPWLGELYPDSHYSTWTTIGNLPTRHNNNTFAAGATLQFYRVRYNDVATGGNSLAGFGRTIRKRTAGDGCSAFFNGVDGSNRYFQHVSDDSATGNRLALAATLYNIFQYPIPPLVNASRPWGMGNNAPPGSGIREWAVSPYNTATYRTVISNPAIGGVNRMFFDNTEGNPWNSSGIVQIQRNAPSTQRAYVLATGTSPSADVGVAELAKTVLVFSLRTFLDGGQRPSTGVSVTGPGHITQLPLVRLSLGQGSSPVSILPVPQVQSPSSVTILVGGPLYNSTGEVPLANVWYRYKGAGLGDANFYTEEYPVASGPLTASTFYEPVTLLYNLKYRPAQSTGWLFVQDGAPAQSGVLDASRAITNTAPVTNVAYEWDVSDTNTFPQGDYRLMVEVYRLGIPQHYAYHTLDVTINR